MNKFRILSNPLSGVCRVLVALACLAGMPAQAQSEQVGQVLDTLHEAAARADASQYFSLFAKNATFIGTDVSEVWSVEEFKAYAMPYFEQGKGWTYHPKTRHIYFSDDGLTAWFDEVLEHATYGITRGTGVLLRQQGNWKLVQYHLTIPIPNALARDISAEINAYRNAMP
ncbi:nuclear transport factor 2 family protein [Alteromonas sp. CYL-A6]|uniref:nuclear transport factor 2 family protein n=1 Tax=Alteromonas nitratireducens TaxID=3390813 RepID=UPI0034BEFAE3